MILLALPSVGALASCILQTHVPCECPFFGGAILTEEWTIELYIYIYICILTLVLVCPACAPGHASQTALVVLLFVPLLCPSILGS